MGLASPSLFLKNLGRTKANLGFLRAGDIDEQMRKPSTPVYRSVQLVFGYFAGTMLCLESSALFFG